MAGSETVVCAGSPPRWTKLPICTSFQNIPFAEQRQLYAGGSTPVCNNLPYVEHANVVVVEQGSATGPYSMGTIVRYVCEDGFQLTSGMTDTIVCSATGWTTVPTCTALGKSFGVEPCGQAPVVDNGFWVGVFEKSVQYRCQRGYAFENLNLTSVTCSSSKSTWSVLPNCVSIQIGCGAAPSIDNAELIAKSFYSNAMKDDRAIFACLPGYALRGSNTSQLIIARCLDSSSWQMSTTACYQATGSPNSNLLGGSCGAAPTLPNGWIVYSQFLTGTIDSSWYWRLGLVHVQRRL